MNHSELSHTAGAVDDSTINIVVVIIIIIIFTLSINVPEKGLKKLVKMKRLGMSKIPCGHKRAYSHVEEQR